MDLHSSLLKLCSYIWQYNPVDYFVEPELVNGHWFLNVYSNDDPEPDDITWSFDGKDFEKKIRNKMRLFKVQINSEEHFYRDYIAFTQLFTIKFPNMPALPSIQYKEWRKMFPEIYNMEISNKTLLLL